MYVKNMQGVRASPMSARKLQPILYLTILWGILGLYSDNAIASKSLETRTLLTFQQFPIYPSGLRIHSLEITQQWSKRNHEESAKVTHRMEENICKPYLIWAYIRNVCISLTSP